MSNSIPQQNKFAEYIAYALNEFVKNAQTNINGDEIYKFSMNVWLEFNDNKKQVSIAEVKLAPLNKALNKKYRKAANE